MRYTRICQPALLFTPSESGSLFLYMKAWTITMTTLLTYQGIEGEDDWWGHNGGYG